jgi:lysophospholipase L1-like esterase
MREGKRKELVFGLLVIFSTIFLFFVFAEIGARLFFHPNLPKKIDRFIYLKSDNERLNYTLKPNSRYLMGNGIRVYINSLGLRDREYDPAAPFPGVRVITLGDSVTFGWAVAADETFSKLLEEKLSDNPLNLPIEVVNAGINGYNLAQYCEMLKRLYPILKPKIAIITIFIDNDFDGNRSYYFGDGFIASQRVHPLHSQGVDLDPPSFIVRKSRFLQFVSSRFRKKKLPPEVENKRAEDVSFIPEGKLYAPVDPDGPIYREARKEVVQMAEFAREKEIRLIFLLIPSLAQVYYDDISRKPEEIVKGFAAELKIEVLDLHPRLKAWHKRTGENPFLDYFHPTPEIHRLIADELQSFLLTRALLGIPVDDIPPTVDIGGDDGIFLVSGFSDKEKGGGVSFRWAMGEESQLLLSSKKTEGSLYLNCYPFIDPDERKQRITVLINGRYGGGLELPSKPGFRDYLLPLKPGLLNKGFNLITFYYGYSVSPREMGTGRDPRKLSVCFDLIGIK